MLVSEIFYSIQGEGALAGLPSVFIRASGCNLRCKWCDTPHASWNPEGREMSVDEIMQQVLRHPSRFVVVTGGEPMIAKGMPDLLSALRANGKHITIETAGTVAPGSIDCDLASISPKLANSTPDPDTDSAWARKHEQTRLRPGVLHAWCDRYFFQLKFVISSPDDLTEVEEIIESIECNGLSIPRANILLMPEGIDRETLAARTAMLIPICKAKGYRFSPRLQIEWFGNKRGT